MSDSSAAQGHEWPRIDPPMVMTVFCKEFASCRWQGKRLVNHTGPQEKPCPKCGKDVVT